VLIRSSIKFDIVGWSLLRYQLVSRLNLPIVEHVAFVQENPDAERVFGLLIARIDMTKTISNYTTSKFQISSECKMLNSNGS